MVIKREKGSTFRFQHAGKGREKGSEAPANGKTAENGNPASESVSHGFSVFQSRHNHRRVSGKIAPPCLPLWPPVPKTTL